MLSRKIAIFKEFSHHSGKRSISSLNRDNKNLGLICGGVGNLGDDAMVEAARLVLPNFKLMRYVHPKQEQRLCRLGLSGSHYFDAVILGGGTLICPTWANAVRLALQQGLPVCSLGTGVGSNGFDQATLVDIQEWKSMLEDFQRIGVRGPYSKKILESIGIKNSEIIGDLALSLAQNSTTIPVNPPKIALNISVPPGQKYQEGDYQRLKDLESPLRKLCNQGWQIVPVVMHPFDISPLSELIYRTTGEEVLPSQIDSAEDFFKVVSSCTFTVAVRLHAAVLSCCAGVPPLMLGYRDKCLDFMQSMYLDDWYINLQNAQPSEISDKMLMLSKTGVDLRSEILDQAKKWQSDIQVYANSISSNFY